MENNDIPLQQIHVRSVTKTLEYRLWHFNGQLYSFPVSFRCASTMCQCHVMESMMHHSVTGCSQVQLSALYLSDH